MKVPVNKPVKHSQMSTGSLVAFNSIQLPNQEPLNTLCFLQLTSEIAFYKLLTKHFEVIHEDFDKSVYSSVDTQLPVR